MLLDRIRTGVLHLAFSTYQPELPKEDEMQDGKPREWNGRTKAESHRS